MVDIIGYRIPMYVCRFTYVGRHEYNKYSAITALLPIITLHLQCHVYYVSYVNCNSTLKMVRFLKKKRSSMLSGTTTQGEILATWYGSFRIQQTSWILESNEEVKLSLATSLHLSRIICHGLHTQLLAVQCARTLWWCLQEMSITTGILDPSCKTHLKALHLRIVYCGFLDSCCFSVNLKANAFKDRCRTIGW